MLTKEKPKWLKWLSLQMSALLSDSALTVQRPRADPSGSQIANAVRENGEGSHPS